MPEPKRRAPLPPVTWRGLRRRTWLVLIVLESVAAALLITGVINSDTTAILVALLIGLVYAPIRAGGWTLVKRLLSRRASPGTADDAFYGRRKK